MEESNKPGENRSSLKIVDPCPEINEAKLLQFESWLKCRLPESYRRFLLNYYGGSIRNTILKYRDSVFGEDTETTMDRLLCIGLDNSVRFTIRYYQKVFLNRVPEELLPVAVDVVDNIICLSLADGSFGKIYFWDHNFASEKAEGEGNDPSLYYNVSYIADDFDGFLAKLYPG